MPLFRRKTAEKQAQPPVVVQNPLKRSPSNRSTKSLPHSPNTPDSWGDDSDIGISQGAFNGSIPGQRRPRTLTLSESVLQDRQDIPDDSLESPMRTSSRLSKTLLEVVRDKDALSCFKSFMKTQRAEHLIQFWCDAESFHASTLMRLRTHSLQNISKSALHKRRSDSLRIANQNTGSKSTDVDPVEDTEGSSNRSPSVGSSSGNSQSNTGKQDAIYDKEMLPAHNAQSLTDKQKLLLGDTQDVKTDHHFFPSSVSETSGIGGQNTPVTNSPSNNSVVNLPESLATKSPDSHLTTTADSNISCDRNISQAPNLPVEKSDIVERNDDISTQAARLQQPSDLDSGVPESPESKDIPTTPDSSQDDISSKLKKSIERDAVTIFSTYIAKDAPKPIGVNDSLRAEAISKICKEDGEVDPECFVSCQQFILSKLDTGYFQSFRDSEFHCRHQVNVLTTEKVYLPDILHNENALCYFTEFMEQEGASDLMQMWLAAQNFQQQLTSSGDYDGEQAQNDAMVIYDRYFSLQATNPLGFDDKLRFQIEGNICREEGPLPDCFTKAKNIVLTLLEKVYFPNYVQSQIYYRYLSDLISTVQMAEDMPTKPYQKSHRRTESDASSEHSIGSQSTGAESIVSRNTLLAVDTRKQRKVGTIEGDFTMNIDMLNPDDLWKRPAAKTDSSPIASNLTLGSVNEFGQFVSQFEHDQDSDRRKGPAILFKRKKEKEKEEEEMALRIAQLIISDVNTMTKTGEQMTRKSES